MENTPSFREVQVAEPRLDKVELPGSVRVFAYRFTTTASSTVGKLAFDLGDSPAAVELRKLEFRKGGNWHVLPKGQSIADASVKTPDDNWVPDANQAFIEFMADTERDFYRRTRAVLKDLGVRVPVTTTQLKPGTPHSH